MRPRLARSLRWIASAVDRPVDSYGLLRSLPRKEVYVAFIDLLGFSQRVEADFHATLELYDDLTDELRLHDRAGGDLRVSILSDSIILTSSSLKDVSFAAQHTWHSITRHEFIARGAIARGVHVEREDAGNRYVVSQALIRAVRAEKCIHTPCVVLCDILPPPEEFAFDGGNLLRTLLWYDGAWIVNPFSIVWGTSAAGHVEELLTRYPANREKFEWFLRLWEAVCRPEPLIPPFELYEYMRKQQVAAP